MFQTFRKKSVMNGVKKLKQEIALAIKSGDLPEGDYSVQSHQEDGLHAIQIEVGQVHHRGTKSSSPIEDLSDCLLEQLEGMADFCMLKNTDPLDKSQSYYVTVSRKELR